MERTFITNIPSDLRNDHANLRGGGSNVSMIICVRVNCLLRKLIKTKTLDKALKASDWFEIGFNHANARFEERAICF